MSTDVQVVIGSVASYDVSLIVPCPSCGGLLKKRVAVLAGLAVSSSGDVFCADCGTVFGPAQQPTGFQRFTQENVHRGSAPLRGIVEIDRGKDGEGMVFHLECGHELRLQRRYYRFSQKRARCPACEVTP